MTSRQKRMAAVISYVNHLDERNEARWKNTWWSLQLAKLGNIVRDAERGVEAGDYDTVEQAIWYEGKKHAKRDGSVLNCEQKLVKQHANTVTV